MITIVAELFAEIAEEHPAEVRLVIVMVELPTVLKPVAVKDPMPAVVTVNVAVKPVALGDDRL